MMHKDKQKEREYYHIETVANMWLSLEFNVFWIGIPLLPITPERKALKKEFFHPIDDYIRCSLASIPTPDIMRMEQSLGLKNHDEISRQLIKKIRLSTFDICYFPILSSCLVFTLVYCMILTTPSAGFYAFYTAGTAAFGGGLASSLMTFEKNRILSLKNILQNELKRRKGKFGSLEGVPALSV